MGGVLKTEVMPHPFDSWKEAYNYAKGAKRAVLVEVDATYAVICPDGTFIDVEHIEGLDIREQHALLIEEERRSDSYRQQHPYHDHRN